MTQMPYRANTLFTGAGHCPTRCYRKNLYEPKLFSVFTSLLDVAILTL
jgi:hypothetical protein